MFGKRDLKIFETLFWPIMDSFNYSTLTNSEFEKNMNEIKPWLEQPFQFERGFVWKFF